MNSDERTYTCALCGYTEDTENLNAQFDTIRDSALPRHDDNYYCRACIDRLYELRLIKLTKSSGTWGYSYRDKFKVNKDALNHVLLRMAVEWLEKNGYNENTL